MPPLPARLTRSICPCSPSTGSCASTPASCGPSNPHPRAVTLDWPGRTLCIQDATEGLCAEIAQTAPLAPGSLVDVAGFSTLAGFKPTLTDASFRAAASGAVPAPSAVTSSQALLGDFDSQRVRIDGRLISRADGGGYTNLLLSANNLVYRVLIPVELAGSRLATIPIGSTLRVTGICSAQVDPERTLRGYGVTRASSFWILLASPRDVAVLQIPSWWTAGHALHALSASLVITFAVFVWVILLRRRVEQQTRELRQSGERYRHMAHHDALTGLPPAPCCTTGCKPQLTAPGATGRTLPCSCSISTGSSRSTIPWATPAAIVSCVSPPNASPPPCARPTAWPAWAATSSLSCSPICPARAGRAHRGQDRRRLVRAHSH